MSASLLQERQTSVSTEVSTLSIALSSSVTAGSTIHAICGGFASSSGTDTFSDNVNSGNYSALTGTTDSTNTSRLNHGYKANVASGTTTVKVTTTGTVAGIWAREIGGVSTTPIDGSNGAKSASPVSVSATNANQPAIWSALGCEDTAIATTTASTGTQDSQGWNLGGSTNIAVTSHNALTTTASQTAKFTSSGQTVMAVIAIFDAAGGGGSTGTASLVEGSDIPAAIGSQAISASAAIVEGEDSPAATGIQSVSASAAVIEQLDTVSASGAAGANAAAAIVESSDTPSGSASLTASSAAAISEGADVPAASGSQSISSSAAVLESPDVGNAQGAVGASATAAIAEGADLVAAAGSLAASGAGTVTEQPDIPSATGSLAISASAAIQEGADIAAGQGGSGTFATGVITESADRVQAAGALTASASAAVAESPDSALASGSLGATGFAAILEGSDIVVATAFAGGGITGSAAIVEGHDIAVAIQEIEAGPGKIKVIAISNASVLQPADPVSVLTGKNNAAVLQAADRVQILTEMPPEVLS